jgi:hypothetical protein
VAVRGPFTLACGSKQCPVGDWSGECTPPPPGPTDVEAMFMSSPIAVSIAFFTSTSMPALASLRCLPPAAGSVFVVVLLTLGPSGLVEWVVGARLAYLFCARSCFFVIGLSGGVAVKTGWSGGIGRWAGWGCCFPLRQRRAGLAETLEGE